MESQTLLLAIIGLIAAMCIGSFTNVIIDRLPLALDEPNEFGDLWDTKPWAAVLGGSSRCSSCSAGIRRRDNIPVFGWLLLRGKCRDCGDRIPAFHPVVELLVPALAALSVYAIGWNWRVLPVLVLIPVAVAVAVIDARTMIVPTRLVWPGFAVVMAASIVAALISHHPSWLVGGAIGLLCLAGPLFVVWFALPQGMGFGDVRLACLLGWIVGFEFAGTRAMAAALPVFLCLLASTMIGLVIGLVFLGARGRKAQVPFGPSLVMGTFICLALVTQIRDGFSL